MNSYNRLLRIIISVLIIVGIFAIVQNLPKKDCSNCNLVLISVDTIRPDHMGIYGYKENTTPNIDNWAQSGTIYTNAKTQVPATYPSFASLLTGKSPFTLGIFGNTLNTHTQEVSKVIPQIGKDVPTLAEILKGNGYVTKAIVSNPVLDPEYTNINRGFDSYTTVNYYADRENYESVILSAFDFIKKNKREKFFLWVHLMDPHAPYKPADQFKCTFGNNNCKAISNVGLQALNSEREKIEGCQETTPSQEKIDIFRTLYDGAIASADNLFGNILDNIYESRLGKDTVVVFYGDHGEGFEHNYFFKHSDVLYESSVRIPLIIKDPTMLGKKLVDTPIATQHVLPILLNILKINRTNLILDESNEPYFANSYANKYAVQLNDFKYIYSLPGACLNTNNTEELYDLKTDPTETKNLVNKNATKTQELKLNLLNFIKTLPNLKYTDHNSSVPTSKHDQILEQLKNLGY